MQIETFTRKVITVNNPGQEDRKAPPNMTQFSKVYGAQEKSPIKEPKIDAQEDGQNKAFYMGYGPNPSEQQIPSETKQMIKGGILEGNSAMLSLLRSTGIYEQSNKPPTTVKGHSFRY